MRWSAAARASATSNSRDNSSSQWQSSITSTIGCTPARARKHARQQRLERGLTQLGIEVACQLVVRDREVDHRAEEWQPGDEPGIDCGQPALERGHLSGRRVAVAQPKQRAPDLPPGEIAGGPAERLTLAERHQVPLPA